MVLNSGSRETGPGKAPIDICIIHMERAAAWSCEMRHQRGGASVTHMEQIQLYKQEVKENIQ